MKRAGPAVLILLAFSAAPAENIDPNNDGSKYAWSENMGWLNARPGGPAPFPGGPTIPDKTGNTCYASGIPWATNAQSNVYWSSTPNANVPSDAWAMDLFSQEVNGGLKTFNLYVWPVRSGR